MTPLIPLKPAAATQLFSERPKADATWASVLVQLTVVIEQTLSQSTSLSTCCTKKGRRPTGPSRLHLRYETLQPHSAKAVARA